MIHSRVSVPRTERISSMQAKAEKPLVDLKSSYEWDGWIEYPQEDERISLGTLRAS
jgi:hypothetical protein